jgi:hypothetical protein
MVMEKTQIELKGMEESIKQILALDFDDYASNFIKITNKHAETVCLEMNSIQRRIDAEITRQETAKKPVRLIILKPRQTGVSTYIQAKILRKTIENFNRTALVVAHTDKATNAIFNKAKFMYENLDPWIKPIKKASNAQELVFDKPSNYKDKSAIGLNSRFKISTAGGTGIARGDTHHYVHLSELAFYEGDIKNIFIGIMQSVPKTAGTIVIIESTAQGYNEYKTMWDAAVNGENEFVPLFFAWHEFEEYQMPVTEEETSVIMSTLNKYEKWLVDTYHVTAAQIRWYRWTLANDCSGDTDLMKQENPSNPYEAFLHTGRPVFNMDNLQRRVEELKAQYDAHPFDIGEIEYDEAKGKYVFALNPNGTVKIYKHPQRGVPYVMGGDTAEGLAGGDWSVSSVGDNTTGEQVAVQRIHMEPDLFAAEQFKLAKYYNNALICDEANPGGHGFYVIKELQNVHKYWFQYKREVVDAISQKREEKYGFQTNSSTRQKLIDRLRAIVRESVELINDLITLNEMLSFVYKDNGKAEGETGCFDDTVFALALMHESRTQQRTFIPGELPEIPKNMHYSIYEDTLKNPQLKKYYKKKYGDNYHKLGGW